MFQNWKNSVLPELSRHVLICPGLSIRHKLSSSLAAFPSLHNFSLILEHTVGY